MFEEIEDLTKYCQVIETPNCLIKIDRVDDNLIEIYVDYGFCEHKWWKIKKEEFEEFERTLDTSTINNNFNRKELELVLKIIEKANREMIKSE